MKRRFGFVSNSSSCSFFVALKEMPTTYDLAQYMIEDRMNYAKSSTNERITWLQESIKNINNPERKHLYKKKEENLKFYNDEIKMQEKYYQDILDKTKTLLKNLKKVTDKNANLAFHSCNFDTFITKVLMQDESFLYVSTCNNIPWSVPKCGLSKLGDSGDIYDGIYNGQFINGKIFLDLDKNKIVNMKKYYDRLSS